MFTLKNYDLSDINSAPSSLDVLYGIFKTTLNPDLTEREFNQYLFGCHPDSFEMSFIYRDETLAGFATSVAYPRKIEGKKVIILRSAFGMIDACKQGNFPLHSLFYKYIRYKLKHLLTPVYVAGFMANPLMYAMICKYTLRCYPNRRQIKHSQKMLSFKDDLLQSMKLKKKEVAPFVLKIHFQVKFKPADIERIQQSTNQDVGYFLSINPRFQEQYGVLVLVPVTITNMAYTLFMYLLRPVKKGFKKFKKPQTAKKMKMTMPDLVTNKT
ncbi:MAG: hypothetical protein JNM14_04630 [Ferruginibacter sp.]|nr:hypothetical protein [Ferruginibacter sp.]